MASSTATGAGRGRTGQVLEFALGEEAYCVSIDCVTEIVDVGELTEVPNAPRHVEGVMDLRGRTTSVVSPKVIFGVDGGSEERRIVVFDPDVVEDQGAVGWLVDEVARVVSVDPGNVDEAPGEEADAVVGVVKREDDLVIRVDPRAVHGG
ncbi:chemotaxis protein CheW [Halobacteriales archaeon QS_5_68_33]|nr:MAG: chemotaxis protein CheW [Halobacteriales archaeon QS_5_68_33]